MFTDLLTVFIKREYLETQTRHLQIMGSPVFWLMMFWRIIQTFQSSLLPQSSGNCKEWYTLKMRWRAFLQRLYLHTNCCSVICPKVGNFISIAVRPLTSTFTNCMCVLLLSSSFSSPSSPSFPLWLFSFVFFLYLSLILLHLPTFLSFSEADF